VPRNAFERIKPATNAAGPSCEVLYKGPFERIVDDRGVEFWRGKWVTVDRATRDLLQAGPWRDDFALGE